MPDRDALLARLYSEYDGESDALLELYESEPPQLAAVYAAFHQRINSVLSFMNSKIYGRGGGHFRAEPSREFIALLQELQEVTGSLKRVGIIVQIRDDYKKVLEACDSFFVASQGSTIPDVFGRVPIEKYEAVFSIGGGLAPGRSSGDRPKLTLVGEGPSRWSTSTAIQCSTSTLRSRRLGRASAIGNRLGSGRSSTR